MEQYIVDNPNEVIQVKKSNSLIQSLGRTTLLGSKVLLAALVKVEDRDGHVATKKESEYYSALKAKTKVDYTRGLVAEFSDAQLRRILKTKSGSYYETIDRLLNSNGLDSFRYQWGIDIKDPKSGLYGFTELISGCIYDKQNNRMFIKFSNEDEVRKEIYDLRGSFALLNYEQAMKFKSQYSYRIWELMLSRIGYQDGTTHTTQDSYSFTYNLSHLKYLLGILDIRKPKVSEELQRKNPDFSKIEELSDEAGDHAMKKYADVKRYCLDKAKKEIDVITDYIFTFEPVRSGRGGKVIAVDLTFTRKNPKTQAKLKDKSNSAVSNENDVDDVIEMAMELFNGILKYREVKSICVAADYDFEKIKTAHTLMSNAPRVDNVVGYCIQAIKENWSSTSHTKNAFNDFQQNTYDYDDLEKRLIAN